MFNNDPLEVCDNEMFVLLEKEKQRQKESINLIASENFINRSVSECLGSCTTNKYSEGYPGGRYYSGNEIIDEIELLCQKRALEAFDLDSEEWGVNVQPLSGSPANVEAIYALVGAQGKILGMHLFSGGHLTHGHKSETQKISITSDLFESMSYKCGSDGYINYDEVRNIALSFQPKLIICGYSSYPRDLDYKRFREICDEVGAYLLCDIAHISGFVATKLMNNPFEYADVVTTTTHKILRAARSGIIFYNKKRVPDIEKKINCSVFPTFQGGPHNNQIAAVCTQLKEVKSEFYRKYAQQTLLNSKALAKYIMENGLDVLTDGTDNHIVIVCLKKFDITGSKMQELSNCINIGLNKNATPQDVNYGISSGIRLGTPAITTRGTVETDMKFIADIILKAVHLAQKIQNDYGRKLVNFRKGLINNPEIENLKTEVINWVSKFPIP